MWHRFLLHLRPPFQYCKRNELLLQSITSAPSSSRDLFRIKDGMPSTTSPTSHSHTLVFSISLGHTRQAPGLALCWRKFKARRLGSIRSYGSQKYLSHRKSRCFREVRLHHPPVESLPARDLLVWDAKSKQGVSPLALMETTNISLAGGKLQ